MSSSFFSEDSSSKTETAKSEMAQSEIFVEQDAKLGNGNYKDAFTLKPATQESVHNFSLPNESDIDKFCLVQFKKFINWTRESRILSMKTDTTKSIYFKENFNDEYKTQIDNIAELRKLFDLGNKSFAPKLHQIRIDSYNYYETIIKYGTPFSPENMDAEFDKPYSQLVKITYVIERCDDSILKFLFKNQGEKHGVDQYVMELKKSDKTDEVGQKVVELIEAFVNSESQLMCDIKSENFCPKIINGTFEKVRFLDVDTQFIINGNGPRFIKNAIDFMKYAFLVHSQRFGEKIEEKRVTFNFGNLGITQEEVDEMIRYFYQEEYMKKFEFNPVNMLYHYFINLHPYNFKPNEPVPYGWERRTKDGKIYYQNTMPIENNEKLKPSQWNYPKDYSFLSYAKLIKYFNINEILEIFHDANSAYKIVLPAETGKTGGGGSKSDASELATVFGKGGKNPRKRRKSKSKKRGRKVRTRKN